MQFPTVIDNSMRETFVACPRRFFYSYIANLTTQAISVHLHAGAAFAKGLEVMRRAFYEQNLSEDDALLAGTKALILAYGDFEPPAQSNKTAERMVEALAYYHDTYPLSTDIIKPYMSNGKASLEFTFAIPLPINHPDTGEPIIYAGRFDMLAVMNNMLIIYDDKTTSQLGASWASKWRLSSQFTGYSWAAREYGFNVEAVVVRGISILKTQFGTAEVITYRPQWMIDRWYEQLLREVQSMIDFYRASTFGSAFPLAQSDACSSYGGCTYMDLCDAQNPEAWIDTQYITREYNPLNVGD